METHFVAIKLRKVHGKTEIETGMLPASTCTYKSNRLILYLLTIQTCICSANMCSPDVKRLCLDTVRKTKCKQALLLCQQFMRARKDNKQRRKCDCACVWAWAGECQMI